MMAIVTLKDIILVATLGFCLVAILSIWTAEWWSRWKRRKR